ncbi:MAG: hypothetical protein AB7L09_02205 [Nitrospira sp.]
MIAAIEWNTDGHVVRIVHVHDPDRPILDVLASGHSLSETDVDWSNRDQVHYRNEYGGWHGRVYLGKLAKGTRHRVWAAEFITFSSDRDNTMLSLDEARARGYDIDQSSPQPSLQQWSFRNGPVYWCERCYDFLPERDPCSCVYWCGICGYQDRRSDQCVHFCDACEGYCIGDCEEAG